METTPPRYHQGFIQNNRGGSSSSDNGFEFLLKWRRRRISTSCWWWWHTLLRRHDLWIHSVLNPSFLRSFLRLNYNALSLWFVVITRSFYLPSPPSERHRKPWSGSRSKNRGNDAVVVRSVYVNWSIPTWSLLSHKRSLEKNTLGVNLWSSAAWSNSGDFSYILHRPEMWGKRSAREREPERSVRSLRDLEDY
jgi:hypothetical protein